MSPLVSIVVPTKNRYKYLKHLIALIESFDDDELELVVQDNSDNNQEILDYLSGQPCPHTHYYYCEGKLSMSQNADLAINNSRGRYICFIGDDDAVCRNIVPCAHWMEENDIDALRSLYLQYSWNEKDGKGDRGSLYFDKHLGVHYRIIDAKEALIHVLREGVPDFCDIPKIYHGIVSRTLVDSIKILGGTCFPGVTPDMSSAVSICFLCRKYVMIDVPVVLPGMSKMVGGGVMGKVLNLDEVGFITQNDRDNWDPGLPRLWATELIWPDCAMKALDYVGKQDYKKYFNKNRMLSRLVVVHRHYFKEAYKYADNKNRFLYEFCRYILVEGLSYLWKKAILSKTTGMINGKYIVKDGLQSISEAESFLMSLIKEKDFQSLI